MKRRLRPVSPALIAAVAFLALLSGNGTARAQGGAPQVERPIAFDAGRRVTVVTPTTAARWKLSAPVWPLGSDWKEARLFTTDSVVGPGSTAVLVVQRVDGSVARYAYSADELTRLRSVIDAVILAQGGTGEGARGTSGLERSEPAGNSFVRSQTVLGLIAYGPATAAILSDNSAAAAGGYLLAAGSAFFISAKTVRNRSVTRAQNTLASHGGTRGALAGAGVAAIANADDGTGFGIPILVGALGGTIVGFKAAGDMSDGEASSSGFAADLGALTAIGVSGVLGAFKDDTASGDDLPSSAKVAIGSAIVGGMAGYWIGPRYANRSAYNVTTGDISVAYMGAILGGLGAATAISEGTDQSTGFAIATGGMLLGTVLADRALVRKADRTPADGTLTVVGTVAGALMGGGVAALAEAESQGALALVTAGGVVGLVIADRMIRPAPDAGPMSGVLRTGSASIGSRSSSRVSLSIVPAATTIALGMRGAQSARPVRLSASGRPTITNVPVMRIAF